LKQSGSRPIRTCLGCRARKDQAQMRRLALARGLEGPLVVWDKKRVLEGRGAWLCATGVDCLEKALRKKVLARAFRLKGEADASRLLPVETGRDGDA
jgi:predicted RNA-binding protein YlxR (DUF448 family)